MVARGDCARAPRRASPAQPFLPTKKGNPKFCRTAKNFFLVFQNSIPKIKKKISAHPNSLRAQEPQSPKASEPKSPKATEDKSPGAQEPQKPGAPQAENFFVKIPTSQYPNIQISQYPNIPTGLCPKIPISPQSLPNLLSVSSQYLLPRSI